MKAEAEGPPSSASRSRRTSPWMRRLDFVLGAPTLFLLGALRRRRTLPPNPKRIAFLRTAAIGDTVLMAACTKAVKAAWPDARLSVVAGTNSAMAALLPGVDDVVQIDALRPLAALRALRREGVWDILVDFGQWPRIDAVLSALTRARFCVGFRTPGQLRHFAYDCVAEHRRDRHEAQNFAALLECIGVPVTGRPTLPRPDRSAVPDRVLIHMFSGGSRGRQKEWSDENWTWIIGALLDEGYRVVLTGDAAEAPSADAMAARFDDRVQSWAGRLDLAQLVEAISGSALTISVDTGVAHIASALGAAMVGLYGPTSPSRWGPLGENGIAVTGNSDCLTCIHLGFETCGREDCMEAIAPAAVLEAAFRHLGSGPAS